MMTLRNTKQAMHSKLVLAIAFSVVKPNFFSFQYIEPSRVTRRHIFFGLLRHFGDYLPFDMLS